MGTEIISIESLSKQIDSQSVLKNISLTLFAGDRVLLVGANGAGKSTLLRIVAGISRPTKGKIVFGAGAKMNGADIGYVGHQSMLYGTMTVEENLFFFADLLKVPRSNIEQLIGRWKLQEHRKKFPTQLSKGLLARVSIARSLCSNPRFIFLDEPTSALDQGSVDILLGELQALAAFHQERFVCVIVTHDLTRLRSFAQRVVVLDEGEVFLDSHLSAEGEGDRVQTSLEVYLERNR